MHLETRQNSRLDAAEMVVTLPSGETVYCLGLRLHNFIVLRGSFTEEKGKRTFTSDPEAKQYLILDGAADVNVVGEDYEAMLRLDSCPLEDKRLSGAADSPLTPIRAGTMRLVFSTTHKRPGLLPKHVVQMVMAHRSWTVAMVTARDPEKTAAHHRLKVTSARAPVRSPKLARPNFVLASSTLVRSPCPKGVLPPSSLSLSTPQPSA